MLVDGIGTPIFRIVANGRDASDAVEVTVTVDESGEVSYEVAGESAVPRGAKGTLLIEPRQFVLRSEWGRVQPSAEDENDHLTRHTWDEYAAWHLRLAEGANDGTKARYAFVYGDSGGCTAWASLPATTVPPSGATRRSSSPRTTSSSDSTPPGPGR